MNFSYNSEMGWEEIICYIVIIFITVIAIISNTISPINQPNQYNTELYELFSVDWWFSMLGVFIFDLFIFYCIYLLSTNRRNLKKWRKRLIDYGNRIDGEVKEIRFIKSNTYRLKVSYFSKYYNKETIFETPNVYIEDLNTNSKIICDVYELGSMEKKHDYEADIFTTKDNTISMNVNPLKLLSTVHKKYTDNNFGNAHAENFKYIEEDN